MCRDADRLATNGDLVPLSVLLLRRVNNSTSSGVARCFVKSTSFLPELLLLLLLKDLLLGVVVVVVVMVDDMESSMVVAIVEDCEAWDKSSILVDGLVGMEAVMVMYCSW